MDPTVYRVHAYDKGMMLFSMLGDALGTDKLDSALKGFLEERRGQLVDWRTLRDALVKRTGAIGRTHLRQWAHPGVPTVAMDYTIAKSGRQWRIKGVLTQKGTKQPFKMNVPLRAVAGEQSADTIVKLQSRKAAFSVKLGEKPYGVLLDPDYRVLLDRPVESKSDVDQEVSAAIKIVNDPGEDDPNKLIAVIQTLRSVLRRGAGDHEGLCHTGVGRCLFRLNRHDEAVTDFKEALRLGAGGPFHRRWIFLRLGCIADLGKKRKEAEEHYRKVIAFGKSDHQTKLARKFLERPYRGYAKDG
jgi:tetratricopeptide (TPR) repeat protein